MTQTSRQSLGAAGEQLARRHLERNGFRFIAANWRCRSGELDLIMRQGETLVFIEVKTRHGDRLGTAEEAVLPRKANRLLRAAQYYLVTRPDLADVFWRIDLVAVTLDDSGVLQRLTHIEDAVRSG
jgi:putative endonuclease